MTGPGSVSHIRSKSSVIMEEILVHYADSEHPSPDWLVINETPCRSSHAANMGMLEPRLDYILNDPGGVGVNINSPKDQR